MGKREQVSRMVGRTATMKKRLFQAIEEHNPFCAIDSLLNGWGMSDVEVAEKLQERSKRADASEFAQHLPAILGDPKAARERLLTLLRDPQPHRIAFLMRGFSKLTDQGDVEEIVQAALDRFSDPVAVMFGWDPRDAELHTKNGPQRPNAKQHRISCMFVHTC
jgi:hypothetical protein